MLRVRCEVADMSNDKVEAALHGAHPTDRWPTPADFLKWLEEDVQLELDDWQKEYIKFFYAGYKPGAKLVRKFKRRYGYYYVWE